MPEVETGHDLVNRLEAENARLTAALELIADETDKTQREQGAPTWRQTSRWHNVARQAIEPIVPNVSDIGTVFDKGKHMAEVATATCEVVINACFGGFSLSHEATMAYAEKKGITLYPDFDHRFSSLSGPQYYTVPVEEFKRLYAEDDEKRNYERSNAVCFSNRDIERDDPALVAVVREMKTAANGRHASLAIVSIPADVEWHIEEYDGNEHVAEDHRTWYGSDDD